MTPERAAKTAQVRTVPANAGHQIGFFRGGDALVYMRNDRNPFEVLVSSDRAADFLAAAEIDQPMELTGFWRRRSGTKADGSRCFKWTLVLLSWSHQVETLRAA